MSLIKRKPQYKTAVCPGPKGVALKIATAAEKRVTLTVMGDFMGGVLQSQSLKGRRHGWARKKGSLIGRSSLCQTIRKRNM